MRKKYLFIVISSVFVLTCMWGCSKKEAPASNTLAEKKTNEAVGQITEKEEEKEGESTELGDDRLEKVQVGQEFKIDLNGDGKEDTFLYNVKDGGESGETVIDKFSINDKDFLNEIKNLKEELPFPDNQWYYITDINSEDSYKEIAILDRGPSEDFTTSFFRYDGEKLLFMEKISGWPSDKEFQLDGQGGVISNGRLHILQTWFAPFTWKENQEGKLELQEMPMYHVEYDQAVLKKKITLYEHNNLQARSFEVEPSDKKITFIVTDNKNWVMLTMADGTQGWVYIKNNNMVVCGKEEVEATEVFDNLCIAD